MGEIGAVMQPPPGGLWGMPSDLLKTLPGYDPNMEKSRADARTLMEKNGYGSDKHLAVTVSTRNLAGYRDPAVILMVMTTLDNLGIVGELKLRLNVCLNVVHVDSGFVLCGVKQP